SREIGPKSARSVALCRRHRTCHMTAPMSRSCLLEEAAALLGVSRRTVYYRIREGRLQTVRIGVTQRVLVDSLRALLEEQAAKDRVADASDTGLCAKYPAP